MRTAFQFVTAIVAAWAACGSSPIAWAQGALNRLEERQFGQANPAAPAKPLVVDPNRAKEPAKNEAEKPAERGFLGVISDDANDKGRGVRIVELVKGSPAEEAGLKVGDLITSINGKAVRQTPDVPDATQGAGPGTKLSITVQRDATIRTITVTLGRRPDDPKLPPQPERDPAPPADLQPGKVVDVPDQPKPPPPAGGAEPPRLGVVMRSYSDDPRFVLGREPLRGVLVLEVLANSPAATAGLRAGDIIIAVSSLAVGDTQSLRDSLATKRAGEEVDVTFYRGRTLYRQKVRLAGAVGGTADAGAIEAPPVPRLSDTQRIEALERRVQELERRLAELEKPVPPAAKKE